MKRRKIGSGFAVALAAAVTLVAGLWAGQPDALAQKQDSGGERLYVLSAQAGELDRVPGRHRVFTLVVRDPNGDVVSFTDRPQRRAGHLKLASFVRSWGRLGFKQDPPNAALVIADAPNSRDVLVVELSKPNLRRDGVAFTAKVLKGSATGALHRFRSRADKRVAASFGEVSLFIDPSGTEYFVAFDLKGVQNYFVNPNFDGFVLQFDSGGSGAASTSGRVPIVRASGSSEFVMNTNRGFRFAPPGFPGNPGAPIDATISVGVIPSASSIDGRIRWTGATGTVTVYRGGYEYTEPIPGGTARDHFFSWPID